MKKIFLLFLLLSCTSWLLAQQQISGTVVSEANIPIANATVLVKGSPTGTITNDSGTFNLIVPGLPTTLVISAVNFGKREITVTGNHPSTISLISLPHIQDSVYIVFKEKPTRFYEVPVSVESFDQKSLRNNPATNYYDLLVNAKGVDVTTSSFTFKTYSTRGFNTSGSARVNQMVDGMDNQAPGLNFYVGNFAGLTELDVERMEVLPGASSALYGPGGMNGTILINSKNPFRYQGLSVVLKQGVTNIDKSQRQTVSGFHDFALRYAKAFKRFAFKVGVQYVKATDWLAGDESNYSRLGDAGRVIPGTRNSESNYDGVNVYGDETSVDIYPFLAIALPGGDSLIENIKVSRTGYHEKDVIDPITKNLKLSSAIHYKISENTEAQLMGFWGTGNTVYTGNNRYALKDITIGQYKLEIKNKNWFLRGYTTQEDAGEAYSATAAMQVLNEMWKPSINMANRNGSWYPQFTAAYVQARRGGADKTTALQMARQYADRERPLPGTTEFTQLFEKVRKEPIPEGGRFLEKSQLWMGEGQYSFAHLFKFIDIVIGANLKEYILDSKGTIFIDSAGAIKINEWGAYAQLTKKINNYVTLSFSGRYDKNSDFEGKFTPRGTALVKIAKDNNLRFSYQTAYRFATSTQKYILLNVGSYTLIGGLPWINDYLKKPVFEVNGTGLKPFVYRPLKPESMQSFEIGYRGLISQRLLIDAYAYFGTYQDFYGRTVLVEGGTNKIYSSLINSSTEVKTNGYGLGFDYRLPNNFSFLLNGYYDVLTDIPSGFRTYFNTPKYRANIGVSNAGLGKKKAIGFNLVARWQDAFYSEGDLASGDVNAFTTVDAQINYKLSKPNLVFKVGGTNILNHYYKNAYGNPEIGGLYYMSLGFGL